MRNLSVFIEINGKNEYVGNIVENNYGEAYSGDLGRNNII